MRRRTSPKRGHSPGQLQLDAASGQGSESQTCAARLRFGRGTSAACRSASRASSAAFRGEVTKWIAPASRIAHSQAVHSPFARARSATTAIRDQRDSALTRANNSSTLPNFVAVNSTTRKLPGASRSSASHSASDLVSRSQSSRVSSRRNAAAHRPERSQTITRGLAARADCKAGKTSGFIVGPNRESDQGPIAQIR